MIARQRRVEAHIERRQQERDQRIRRELAALNRVMRVLLKLPQEKRVRVLRALHELYRADD